MRPIGIKTTFRVRDISFDIEAAEEDGLIDFLMEEMDTDRQHEEYVCNHCLATMTPDELEYLAKRILDAVAYERSRLEKLVPTEMR